MHKILSTNDCFLDAKYCTSCFARGWTRWATPPPPPGLQDQIPKSSPAVPEAQSFGVESLALFATPNQPSFLIKKKVLENSIFLSPSRVDFECVAEMGSLKRVYDQSKLLFLITLLFPDLNYFSDLHPPKKNRAKGPAFPTSRNLLFYSPLSPLSSPSLLAELIFPFSLLLLMYLPISCRIYIFIIFL